MDKQEDFIKYIRYKETEYIKVFLNDKDIDPSFQNNLAIRTAAEIGCFEIVELLLKDKRVDANESIGYGNAIRYASQSNYIDIVKLLLRNNIDPSKNDNIAIIASNNNDIINLLWQDQRVKNTLEKNNFKLHNKLIKKDIQNKIGYF